jgi:hypothetical protein
VVSYQHEVDCIEDMPPKDRAAFLCHMAQKYIASVGPSLEQLLDRHSAAVHAAQ